MTLSIVPWQCSSHSTHVLFPRSNMYNHDTLNWSLSRPNETCVFIFDEHPHGRICAYDSFLPMPSLHLSAAMKMNLTLVQAILVLCLARSHATTIPMVLHCLSTCWGLRPSHKSTQVDFLRVSHENPTNKGCVPFNSKPVDARWEASVARCTT